MFDPLDFLAEVTQHIPDPGEHLIRYYGFYSNQSRGLQAKAQAAPGAASAPEPAPALSAKEARKRWACLRADTHRQAALIKLYEADPLLCPKCGAQRKIISFFERHQTEVTCLPAGRSRRFSGLAGCACLPKPRRRQGSRSRFAARPPPNSWFAKAAESSKLGRPMGA